MPDKILQKYLSVKSALFTYLYSFFKIVFLTENKLNLIKRLKFGRFSCFQLASIVAFFSASQDIVVDAHRREWLTEGQMGSGTALFVNAYKLSTLVPGSLSLILSDLISWDWVFLITGLFMLPGILTTLLVSEPREYGPPPQTMKEAVIEPFKEFIHRSGWKHAAFILLFIFLYKLGDSMASALATPFYIELGFTRTEIGLVAKNGQPVAVFQNLVVQHRHGLGQKRLGLGLPLQRTGDRHQTAQKDIQHHRS